MKSIVYKSKELYWKRIQLISFVLAVFIIIRHNSSVANYDSPLILSIYYAFKNTITEIAVPLFFLISGFNFFRDYSNEKYKKKFTSRIKSLLVPYLTWNTIYCIFSIIISMDFFSRFFIGREKFVISPLNVFLGCIFHNSCNSHFWFVFDLMICVLLNPIMYYILRKKIFGLPFLALLYVAIMCFGLSLPVAIFYRTDAFLYYYIGAFLGLHHSDFFFKDKLWKNNDADANKMHSAHIVYFAIGFLCVCTCLVLLVPNIPGAIRCLIILIAAYGFWNISACCRYIKFNWLPAGGTTFLLYAAHGIIQPIIVKVLYLLLPKIGWVSIVNFILAVSLTVLLCMGLRYVTKRYIPMLDNILTGWRR